MNDAPVGSGEELNFTNLGLDQIDGLYGSIIVDPAGTDPIRTDRDYVIVLSDSPRKNPVR